MSAKPVAVFDSGVGGLTVFHAVEQALPGEPLLYLGDTARVPYGTRSPETVTRYACEAAEFVRRQGVRMLIVACNTASSVALAAMAKVAQVPVLGVIRPGARRAVELSAGGRIGVIGTRATIESRAYQREIHAQRPAADVSGQACPLFVPLAEEGWIDDPVTFQVARRYLEPLIAKRIDTLVLGCTHYPLLRDVIAEVVGPEVQLVDSAQAVAREVRQRLDLPLSGDATAAPDAAAAPIEHHFYVTDDPGPFQHVAERFLGRAIRRLEKIETPGLA